MNTSVHVVQSLGIIEFVYFTICARRVVGMHTLNLNYLVYKLYILYLVC